MSVIKLNTQNFDENVLNSQESVLVKFGADWCGPCKAIAPTLEEVASEGKNKIFEVDVDESPELAQRFNVRGIPALLYFKDSEVKDSFVGVRPKSAIVDGFASLSS